MGAAGSTLPGVKVHGAKGQRRADEALLHELPCPLGRGEETVVEGHLADALPAPGRRLHGRGFLHGRRQRLVAVDMLARRHGGDKLLRVRRVGRADVDDLDVLAFDQRAPVVRPRLEPAVAPGRLGRFPARRGHADETHRDRRWIIMEGNGAVRVGVHLADEAVPDDADAYRVHQSPSRNETTSAILHWLGDEAVEPVGEKALRVALHCVRGERHERPTRARRHAWRASPPSRSCRAAGCP